MTSTQIQELIGEGQCLSCYGLSLFETIQASLLGQIAIGGGGGGGGGGGNPPVVYTPPAQPADPANKNLPAIAYSSTGAGSFFGWDVSTQTWK